MPPLQLLPAITCRNPAENRKDWDWPRPPPVEGQDRFCDPGLVVGMLNSPSGSSGRHVSLLSGTAHNLSQGRGYLVGLRYEDTNHTTMCVAPGKQTHTQGLGPCSGDDHARVTAGTLTLVEGTVLSFWIAPVQPIRSGIQMACHKQLQLLYATGSLAYHSSCVFLSFWKLLLCPSWKVIPRARFATPMLCSKRGKINGPIRKTHFGVKHRRTPFTNFRNRSHLAVCKTHHNITSAMFQKRQD